MNKSFAETAMEMAGKSKEEAQATGKIDAADDQVEEMFEERYKTVNSPIHKAVWGELDLNLFDSSPNGIGVVAKFKDNDFVDLTGTDVMMTSYDILVRHAEAGTMLDENGKHNPEMIKELADAGYFGTLVELPGKRRMLFRSFIHYLSRNATVNAQVAGLSSVHGCIGAVDPIMAFGTPEQQKRFLPLLASGVQSGFALTEPNAGSDLTALKTTAKLHHRTSPDPKDYYLVNGEKLFITNAWPGGIVGLVCKDEDTGNPMVLIVELPEEENENFQWKHYGIHALSEMRNCGLIFKDFKVPAENLIQEDGLLVAYHGLNYGRTAVCANANGCLKRMMTSMLPWAKFRETYGASIDTRELVQRRVARLAGFIVGSEAIMNWTSKLLDEGYRGEMECIIAKIAGSEWQKEAAIELFMKTHGGRSFLHGHLFGDNVHEFLAPCIYEGEGEMLGMAFFKALVKEHGKNYYEEMGKAVGKPTFGNIVKAVVTKPGVFTPYLKWSMGNSMKTSSVPREVKKLDKLLQPHVRYAIVGLQHMSSEIDKAMFKYKLKLVDKQCRMSFLSQKVQDLVTILVTALYADWVGGHYIDAAHVLCTELEQKIDGNHPSDDDYRFMTKFGGRLADEFEKNGMFGINPDEILMSY